MSQLISFLASGVKNATGVSLASGKAYVYSAGTTNPVTVYEDASLTNPISNPITLDAFGRAFAYTDKNIGLVVESFDRAYSLSIERIEYIRGNLTSELFAANSVKPGLLNSDVAGNGLKIDALGKLAIDTDPAKISIVNDKIIVIGHGLNIAISQALPIFRTFTNTFQTIPLFSCTITTTGRPVLVFLDSVKGSAGKVFAESAMTADIKLMRDSNDQRDNRVGIGLHRGFSMPPGSFKWFQNISAGTYTYTIQMSTASIESPSINAVGLQNVTLNAMEI